MTNKPDQPVAEEEGSVVQEDAIAADATAAKPTKVAAKKSTTKKAAGKRKPTSATGKRRKAIAKPVAPPPPLTLQELKEQGAQAKRELISAVIEPAVDVVGSLSQTVRDTIGGAFAGLLSRKRRD